jgi:LPXTG-motif cell wall-anchored protein
MQGFVYSGELVPGMGNRESSYSGGDAGLNYRFLNVPESNENNYSSKDRMPDPPKRFEEEADFSLFPCREQCKKELGGKGFGFRDCIRECKGKGPRKSVLKGKDLAIQENAVKALSDDDTQRTAQEEQTGSKKTMWIIIGSLVVVGIAIAVYFLTRKKTEAVA